MEPDKARPSCWICRNPVSLEECKIDDDGQAVHEPCYIRVVTRKSGSTVSSPRTNQDFHGGNVTARWALGALFPQHLHYST